MGNKKFKLSDMIPNAWFYKLKDMSRTRKQNNSRTTKKKNSPITTITHQKPTQLSHPLSSKANRFSASNSKTSDTHFSNPPRKSSKKTTTARRKAFSKPSHKPISNSASAHHNTHPARPKPDGWNNPNRVQSPDYVVYSTDQSNSVHSEFDCDDFVVTDPFVGLPSWSSSCNCRLSSSTADIIIDLNNGENSVKKTEKIDGFFDIISELELPPILTKPMNFDDTIFEATKYRSRISSSSKLEKIKAGNVSESLSVKIVKEESFNRKKEQRSSSNHFGRKSSSSTTSSSTGIRLRANSPRLASKKIQAHNKAARKSVSSSSARNRHLSESFAVVKSSIDPQRDFRESMVEMIVENNIRASKDLEELLACYLSLNSKDYHDLIVKAFEQIWFDMADIPM